MNARDTADKLKIRDTYRHWYPHATRIENWAQSLFTNRNFGNQITVVPALIKEMFNPAYNNATGPGGSYTLDKRAATPIPVPKNQSQAQKDKQKKADVAAEFDFFMRVYNNDLRAGTGLRFLYDHREP